MLLSPIGGWGFRLALSIGKIQNKVLNTTKLKHLWGINSTNKKEKSTSNLTTPKFLTHGSEIDSKALRYGKKEVRVTRFFLFNHVSQSLYKFQSVHSFHLFSSCLNVHTIYLKVNQCIGHHFIVQPSARQIGSCANWCDYQHKHLLGCVERLVSHS